MMFRSLFFVSPLLAAGKVCQGEVCQDSEQTAMLQLKGRDSPEAQALLQRSFSSQTLSTLEENLMGKDNIDRAKCTYYLKNADGDAMTPCEQLSVLEKTFKDSMKDVKEFDKTMEKTIDSVMDSLSKSLSELDFSKGAAALGESLHAAADAWALGMNAESVELEKLTKTIREAEEKLGMGSAFTEALSSLTTGAQDDLRTIAQEIEQDVKQVFADLRTQLAAEVPSPAQPEPLVVAGEGGDEGPATTTTTTTTTTTVANPALIAQEAKTSSGPLEQFEQELGKLLTEDLQELSKKLKEKIKKPIQLLKDFFKVEFAEFMNTLGRQVAQFWKTVLHFPAAAEAADPFDGFDWSKDRDINKLQKIFWPVAKGYLDAVEHVESDCKSAAFKKENDFAVRKICRSNDKPRCTDEFLYTQAEKGEGTDGPCANIRALSRRDRNRPLSGELDYFEICQTGKDLDKACKIIEKAEKKAAKEARR